MNINTRNMNFVNYNGQEMDWVKFNGDLVYENYKTLTSEGVPPLTLNKCKNTNMLGYKVYGDSTQQTYTGKNLCNPNLFINTGNLLNGTNGNLNTNANYITTDFVFIKAGTYTLSLDNTYDGTGNTTTRICLYNTSYSYTGNAISDTSFRPSHPTYTFIISSDCYYRLSVRNTDENIMIEQSSTATEYEPYVGGIPAPNPSFPQEIESVGDKTKNLYAGNNEYTVSEVTNATPREWYVMEASKTYTIAMYIDNSKGTGSTAFRMSVGKSGGWDYNRSNKISAGSKGWARTTFTVDTTYNNQLNMQYQPVGEATFSKIMLLEGSYTVAQLPEYEPYGYKIPIKIKGKNYLNENASIFGYISSSGAIASNSSIKTTDFIKVEKDKYYTFSYDYDTLYGTTSKNYAFYTNKDISSAYSINSYDPRNKGFTVQAPINGYIRISYYINLKEWQFEENTTPTSYEAYREPLTTNIYLDEPLRKIGNADVVKLPSGYTQVEYIEGTGTQYINTGITATNNTGMNIKYCYTADGSAAISGIFKSANPRQDVFFISSQTGSLPGTGFMAHRGNTTSTTLGDVSLNTDYTAKINYKNDGKIYYNDNYIVDVGTNATYNATILIFARLNASNQNITASNSRIYYVEFTEGNTISHKFIPCINDQNVIGMYDLVSKQFFSNQGTGTFIAGSPVYADYLDFENQKVYRQIGQHSLEGYTFNKTADANYGDYFVNSVVLTDLNIKKSVDLNDINKYVFANFAKAINVVDRRNFINAVRVYITPTNFIVRNSINQEFASASALQTFLSDESNYIVYVLATPTEESIELPDILLNKGTNVIDVDTSITPSNIWIKYKGKGDT